jgi:fatty-acid desaturase
VKQRVVAISKRIGVNWFTAVILALFHIGAVAALFMFSWRNLAVAAILYYVATGLGISMGYHRLHTHRSYKVPLWLEYFFALCGSLTLEGGPIFWVATHRLHHQYSDLPGDPHSPNDGAFWSHVGWILFGETNHNNTKLMSKYAPDLARHPFYVWLNDYHWIPGTVLGLALLAIGGLPMMLWGICLRVVVGLHATWLSFGEGWHNNHHAHPTSARHGLAWYEFDPSWLLVKALRFFGVAKAVHVASVDSGIADREAA